MLATLPGMHQAPTTRNASSSCSFKQIPPCSQHRSFGAGMSSTWHSADSSVLRAASSESASTSTSSNTIPAAGGRRSRGVASSIKRNLVTALAEQVQKEALPWVNDLLAPLLDGPPAPLTGTLPPQQLGDKDSRFVTVNGVSLHYKEVQTGRPRPSRASIFNDPPLQVDNHTATAADWSEEAALSAADAAQAAQSIADADAAATAAAAGEPPTLLLMHGFNGSVFNWRLMMDDLAAYISPATGCRIIAFDRPPFGLAERPLSWQGEENNPYTTQAGAEFAYGLLQALGVKRAIAVGHSAGGPVAVELARRHPEAVSGLILVAPAITTDSKGFLARADLGQLARFAFTRLLLANEWTGLNYIRRQVNRRRDDVLGGKFGIYYDERDIPQEVIDGYLKPMLADDWDRGSLYVARSFNLSEPPRLVDLPQPVLVVQGDKDSAVPATLGRAVAKVFATRPGGVSEYVELEQCGHLPMEEQPDKVVKAMTAFVNTHCLN